MFSSLGLIWRTLRYLKPIQIFGRLRFRLMKPRLYTTSLPKKSVFKGCTTRPACRRASMIGPFRWISLIKWDVFPRLGGRMLAGLSFGAIINIILMILMQKMPAMGNMAYRFNRQMG